MTSRAKPLRILLPFLNKCECFNYGKGALYASVTLSSGTRRFFTDLPERVREVVVKEEESRAQTTEDVLRKWGYEDTHIAAIFKRYPPFRNGVVANLESKLNSLHKLGVTSSDLVKVIHRNPYIIHRHCNQNFDERIDQLKSLFGSEQVLVKAVVRNPYLMVYNFEDGIKPVFALYEEMGVSRKDLISMLLNRNFIPQTKMCEEKLEYIRRTGVTKESKMFKYVVTIIGSSRLDTIREKIANLEKFGIPEDEVLLFFGRNPFVMLLSVNKVQRNMTFVIGTLKLPTSRVLKSAFLLTCNLENPLKSRVLLAGKIQDMGLEPQIKGPLLLRALKMPEKRFLKVFVNCHEDDIRLELLAYYKACQGIKRLASSIKKSPFSRGNPF